MKKRQSGVLMHISSLPGQYGIGSFGQSAYDFVDFLVRTKQRYWQILPLGTTSYGVLHTNLSQLLLGTLILLISIF